MEGLFGKTKYIPQDEKDLAEYLLWRTPFAKENVHEFEIAWIEHTLDIELSAIQKARLSKFSLINGNRRRQEIQLANPQLQPSPKEQRRRSYLSRGEHLRV